MENSAQFVAWRASFSIEKKHYFNYSEQDMKISFQVKLQRRKRVLKELVVGYIFSNSEDAAFVERGFKAFFKHTKKIHFISLISVATNYANQGIYTKLIDKYFRKISNKIYFAVKPLTDHGSNFLEAKNWFLMRADIDTY